MKDCMCSRGGLDLKTEMKVCTPVTARTAVCGVVFKITMFFFLGAVSSNEHLNVELFPSAQAVAWRAAFSSPP